jgi:hypothetical protein
MDLRPIPTFESVSEAANHFTEIYERRILKGIPGDLAGLDEKCILTGGPKDTSDPSDRHKQVRNKFWLKGVRVNISGPHGNRQIKVLGFKDRYVRSSKRPSGASLWD